MNPDFQSRQAQFEFERELRERILSSSKENRLTVTSQAYAELFDRFPSHIGYSRDKSLSDRVASHGAAMIGSLAKPGDRILEVGCGQGEVIEALAKRGCKCVGLEASEHMVRQCKKRKRVKVMLGTAERLDFQDESFDLVFSRQTLEHLHPEDVPIHFSQAFRVLRPGGILAAETPNRRTGPQDVSRGFTPVAQGLHLKEWTVKEIIEQFKSAGFKKIRGLLVPPFLIRRRPELHSVSRIPAWLKYLQDLTLTLVPGMNVRTCYGKIIGLDDIFLFGSKPKSVEDRI